MVFYYLFLVKKTEGLSFLFYKSMNCVYTELEICIGPSSNSLEDMKNTK